MEGSITGFVDGHKYNMCVRAQFLKPYTDVEALQELSECMGAPSTNTTCNIYLVKSCTIQHMIMYKLNLINSFIFLEITVAVFHNSGCPTWTLWILC